LNLGTWNVYFLTAFIITSNLREKGRKLVSLVSSSMNPIYVSCTR